MATIPLTEDEVRAAIRRLEDGLLTPAKATAFGDRSTTYKTAEEIMPSLEYYRGLLAQFTTVTPRKKQFHSVATKGF